MEKKVKKVVKTKVKKTLDNTTISKAKDNVSDLKVFGNGDLFKLLSKASSDNEQWMKSTKCMEIKGAGCVLQVTTQQGDSIAEAVTFVPGVKLVNIKNDKNEIIGRELKAI